ncbi:MAG: acyl-CoA dehydrogenase family protein, partial [Candidatus Thermoplasmatota archaeon]
MRLELTEEQLKFRALVRDFAEKEIAPIAREIDEKDKIQDAVNKAAKVGLLGMPIPKEYGGLGLDNVGYTIGIEEISRVSGSLGLTLEAHNSLCLWHIYNNGNEEQRRKYVVPLAKGQYLGALALTEPLAGSDIASIQTTAKLEGNYWVLNGTKLFITNGDIAGTIVVMAVTDKTKGAKGISTFVVEKGTEGLSYGKKEDKLGLRGCRTVELILDNCKVPKENLLGKENFGFINV